MKVAQDSIFGGHLGNKETKDRIQINFAGLTCSGIASFRRSCNECQQTVAKGCV